MHIQPFKLERYFAEYEFSVKYLLSASDCESLSLSELLALASLESRALWDGLSLGYTESPGHPLLRAAIAAQYSQLDAGQVLVAAPEEAIFIAMQTLLSPGDQVIAIAPAYQSLSEIARAAGCQVTPWTLRASAGRWELDLPALERSFTPRTRLLVVNFPHNPTGLLPSRAEFEALVELARRHNCYLFSDEMYRLLEHDPAARLPAACDLYEKAVSLGGLSKTFALPGLRIGWLACADRSLLARCQAFKDYTTICSSAPSEILALIALQNSAAIVQRSLEIVRANAALAAEFCRRRPAQFEWFAPQAGSIAFPRWLGAGTLEQFCQGVLESRGVMVVPGSLFDYPGGHFRVGLGRKNFPAALQQVEEYLN